MKQGFRFHSGKTAYSIEELRRLCEEESTEAIKHLNDGYIEQWLDYIGETELATIAYGIRKDKILSKGKSQIDTLIVYLNRHVYFQNKLNIIDANKSIDIVLKEYEMPR